MNQIMPYPLWIGHAGECRAFAEAFARDIKVVVQLALEEPPLQPPHELVYFRFPLLDGNGNDPTWFISPSLRGNLDARNANAGGCGAGMSRSPAIVAAALSMVEHAELEKCLERVTRMRPPTYRPAFWDDVVKSFQAESHRK